MSTLIKMLVLLLFTIAIGRVTFFLVLTAIGGAVYSVETFASSVAILIGLAIVSVGVWLAQMLQRMTLVAIALQQMFSSVASLAVVALAGTTAIFCFSGPENLLFGGIAIAVASIALGIAGFSGRLTFLHIRNWLRVAGI